MVNSSVAGFGGGVIMLVVLSIYFDIKEAAALATIYFLFNSSVKSHAYRHTIDKEFLAYALLGALPALALGLSFFIKAESRTLEIILACLCFYIVASQFLHLPRVKHLTTWKIIIGGACWGFITGVINGMPIKVLMLKWRNLEKEWFVGTGAVMSGVMDLIKVIFYALSGLYLTNNVLIMIPTVFISLIGTRAGKQCLEKISPNTFQWILTGLMLIGGIKFMIG